MIEVHRSVMDRYRCLSEGPSEDGLLACNGQIPTAVLAAGLLQGTRS